MTDDDLECRRELKGAARRPWNSDLAEVGQGLLQGGSPDTASITLALADAPPFLPPAPSLLIPASHWH